MYLWIPNLCTVYWFNRNGHAKPGQLSRIITIKKLFQKCILFKKNTSFYDDRSGLIGIHLYSGPLRFLRDEIVHWICQSIFLERFHDMNFLATRIFRDRFFACNRSTVLFWMGYLRKISALWWLFVYVGLFHYYHHIIWTRQFIKYSSLTFSRDFATRDFRSRNLRVTAGSQFFRLLEVKQSPSAFMIKEINNILQFELVHWIFYSLHSYELGSEQCRFK